MKTIRCTTNALVNLREGAGVTYGLIETLPPGTLLIGLKCAADAPWLLAETETGNVGWIHLDYVTCREDPAGLPTAAISFGPTLATPTPGVVAVTTTPTPTRTSTPTSGGPPPVNSWQGQYYDNASLQGTPVLTRTDLEINFDWGLSSPAPNIPADNFSVRWTRQIQAASGTDVQLFADADDGLKLYVDTQLLIDEWNTNPPLIHEGRLADIAPGAHTLVIEYFESGAYARVKVWGGETVLADPVWQAEYYPNVKLQGPPLLTRQDSAINFNWGNGSPAEGLDGNNFSVRWTRTVFLDRGDYKFAAEIGARDGVTIFLDDQIVVGKHTEEGGKVEGSFARVEAGNHTLKVEYFEEGGEARIHFGWAKMD
jgi:uncharacterized protein YraI